jgi:hypothetical protein
VLDDVQRLTPGREKTHPSRVNYDEFKAAFLAALKESKLPTISVAPGEETLNLRSMDRTFTVYVEPMGRQIGGPFHVTGAISWRWDALQTARTATTEEDLLAELLGREEGRDIETERPWLRIDIQLRASLAFGKSIPLPAAKVWEKWSREAIGRLENIERLVTEEVTRETADGRHAVLAWQGDPEIKLTCNPLGGLRLESLSVRAFQGIDLLRRWDDPEREPDEDPYQHLAAMLQRLKAALYAWGEVMDHLA